MQTGKSMPRRWARVWIKYDVSGPYLIDAYPSFTDAVLDMDPFQRWTAGRARRAS